MRSAGLNVTWLIQNHFNSAPIVLKKRGEDDVQHEPGVRRHRALFISDLHLGTKACQASAFLEFLRFHDAPQIYLVGDIVDFWRIKRGTYWPQAHNDVLQKLLRKVRNHLRVAGVSNVHLRHGDGHAGMPEVAPFDAIVMAAAAASAPPALLGQLGPGGRMVLPIEKRGEQLALFG